MGRAELRWHESADLISLVLVFCPSALPNPKLTVCVEMLAEAENKTQHKVEGYTRLGIKGFLG